MVEIEVKISIDDIKKTREKILGLGAKLEKERFSEENTLYDFPAETLYKKRQALRLRRMNKKSFLTFKGSPQKSRKFKIREEYETEVKNEKQLRKILKSLGLVPVFNYEKQRTVYRKKKLENISGRNVYRELYRAGGQKRRNRKICQRLRRFKERIHKAGLYPAY